MALTRRYIERKEETKSFYNPVNGVFYSEVSKLHRLGEKATLADAFKVCDTDNLYICPMPKGSYTDRDSIYPKKLDLEKISGVEIAKDEKGNPRYYSKTGSATMWVGEKQFDLFPIGVWFEFPEGANLSDAVIAMVRLKEILTEHFQPAIVHQGKHESFPVEILATPALTSMDLLRRKLPVKARYENLPPDIESILLKNFSQARTELFDHNQDIIETLYNYDGLWYYASCCRHVPTGRIVHDYENELAMTAPSKNGYRSTIAGFYRVNVTVPDNWCHIGLLPTKNTTGLKKRSIYPNKPGNSFESWCSDKELRLARDHGWHFEILERILWPDTQARKADLGQDRFDRTGQDPLRYWMETLVDLRQNIILKYPEPVRSMLKDAIRNLLNMGVGKMHAGKNKHNDVYADSFDDIVEDGLHFVDENFITGEIHYTKETELTAYQKQTFHPHWTLYVWCTCKAKITQAALTVPYEHLVSIRTDGLWTTCPCDFENTGKPGCLREKELVNKGPFPWPKKDVDFKKEEESFVHMIQLARGGNE